MFKQGLLWQAHLQISNSSENEIASSRDTLVAKRLRVLGSSEINFIKIDLPFAAFHLSGRVHCYLDQFWESVCFSRELPAGCDLV